MKNAGTSPDGFKTNLLSVNIPDSPGEENFYMLFIHCLLDTLIGPTVDYTSACRITSYNVCYTKLLRIGYDIDNPGARVLTGLLFKKVCAYSKGKKYSFLDHARVVATSYMFSRTFL